MELRIARLEGFANDYQKDIRTVDVRLAKIETHTEVLAKNAAMRTDISVLEVALVKWIIATAIGTIGVGVAVFRFLH